MTDTVVLCSLGHTDNIGVLLLLGPDGLKTPNGRVVPVLPTLPCRIGDYKKGEPIFSVGGPFRLR